MLARKKAALHSRLVGIRWVERTFKRFCSLEVKELEVKKRKRTRLGEKRRDECKSLKATLASVTEEERRQKRRYSPNRVVKE